MMGILIPFEYWNKHSLSAVLIKFHTDFVSPSQCSPWISSNYPWQWQSDHLMYVAFPLTQWGRMTHICVSNLTITGSHNGLSPGRRQAIIWTNAEILLIGRLGTNFSEILIKINTFSFKKMPLKMSSGKWQPFCLGLNVLTNTLRQRQNGRHFADSIVKYIFTNKTMNFDWLFIEICSLGSNLYIWQSLSLCVWRWKSVVTLRWMGATFSGSGLAPTEYRQRHPVCTGYLAVNDNVIWMREIYINSDPVTTWYLFFNMTF